MEIRHFGNLHQRVTFIKSGQRRTVNRGPLDSPIGYPTLLTADQLQEGGEGVDDPGVERVVDPRDSRRGPGGADVPVVQDQDAVVEDHPSLDDPAVVEDHLGDDVPEAQDQEQRDSRNLM